jgi:HAD domain in Swiss Army Knife RNA repair proteins
MRVIFLDIDGVLNCESTTNPRKLPYVVEPRLLELLKRLLTLADAKVVLSSTWRYDPAGVFSAKHWGIPFIDVIPDMPARPRRDEIVAWLKTHPEVERYAVIDDEDDELDDLPLFQPSARTGLSDEIVDGVVAYLTRRTDKDMRRSRLKRVFQNVYTALKGHQG